ncbi:MAG: HAD family hydrolase [Maribacter sp.]
MDLSKIKMVVSDMDGTLLNSNHEVSNRFFDLFQELKSKNIQFVAASGRQYGSIVEKLYPIKDDIIFIAENGGFAMCKDQEILSTPLPKTNISSILTILKDIPNVHPILCGKHNAYISNASDTIINRLNEYFSNFTSIENLHSFNEEVIKIAFYHFDSSEKYIYPFLKHLKNTLKVKISGKNWVDVSSLNAHKGYALDKVMSLYKIKPEELLVFGDYNNDLEMLALTDFSFAMENAHPNVKKAANYATSSNDDYGVERILEKLVS